MWLEINKNKTIIAKHSHQFDSENEWVEYDGMADIGDQWENGTVVARVPSDSELLATRKNKVRKHILRKYPLWKQINILREGDTEQIKTMTAFIDACRACVDNPDQLTDIDAE